jgi:hypothetical protein
MSTKKAPNNKSKPAEVETEKVKTEVKVEREYVEVFIHKQLILNGLPPMYPKIRYRVPKDRLSEFPEDSYVLI